MKVASAIRCVAVTAIGVACLSTAPPPVLAGDEAGAERQYRIARRLAAEGSPEAADALRRVVELDPKGPLADDALIDLARVHPLPEWPSGLGRITVENRDDAAALLDRLLQDVPAGDRAPEAAYRRTLLKLEPLQGSDPSSARLDLARVATDPSGGEWAQRARLTMAWLDTRAGRAAAAEAGLHRLMIDHPRSESAMRAEVFLSWLEMYAASFGTAAARLDRVAENLGVDIPELTELQELAVVGALRSAGAGGTWGKARPRPRAATGVRGLAGLAGAPDGGVVIADRKTGSVVRFDRAGAETNRWMVDDPGAVTVDPFGRVWAVSGDRAVRLRSSGAVEHGASLAKIAPVSGFAVDADGAVWVSDRKGARVFRVVPGSDGPREVWAGDDERITALAWDRRRIVALDGKNGRLLSLTDGGRTAPIGGATFEKANGMAVDAAGQVAVLDLREAAVILVGPDGVERDRVALSTVGVPKPVGMTLAADGSVVLFDGTGGALVRLP